MFKTFETIRGTVTWEAPNDTITEYRVSLEKLNTSTAQYERVGTPVTVSGLTHELKGLQYEGQYRATITPHDGKIYNAEHAVTVELSVPKAPAVEEPVVVISVVENIVAKTDEANAAIVTWDAFASGDEVSTRYQIQRFILSKETGEFVTEGSAISVNGTTYKDTAVKADNEYRYEVSPMVNWQYVEASVGRSNSLTLAPVDIPVVIVKPLVNNVVATLDANNARVTWDTFIVNGENSSRYRVQMYSKNEAGEFVKDGTVKSATGNTLEVKGLTVGKEYYFQVIPMVDWKYVEEYANISNKVKVAATEVKPVDPVTTNKVLNVLASLADKKVTITWNPYLVGGTPTTKYRVQPFMKNKETGLFELKGSPVVASANTLVLEGNKFELDNEYYFQVIPLVSNKYDVQFSGKSNTVFVDPAQFVVKAEPIPNLHVIMNGSEATVLWKPITIAGEVITRYRVQRHVLDEATGTYKVDLYAPSVNATSYVDEYYKAGSIYRYEVTPLSYVSGRYLFEHTTTIYFVELQEQGQTRVFFGTDPDMDPSVATGKETTVQRYVLDDTGQFVLDGEPFTIDRYDFVDQTTVVGKHYRYEFVTKSTN